MDTIVSTNYTTSFIINRLLEKRLQSVSYNMTFHLSIDTEVEGEKQVKYLNLIRMWLDNILDDCIAFNVHTELSTDVLGEVTNHVMFCPDEPHDYLLMLLIVAKINAVGSGVVSVESAEVGSDSNQGFGYTLIGDPLEVLITAEEWMGKERFFEQPWWNRSDGGMMDLPLDTDEDPNNKPDILIDLENKGSFVKADVITPDDSKSAEIIKLTFANKSKND